jgi:hypothetical protein
MLTLAHVMTRKLFLFPYFFTFYGLGTVACFSPQTDASLPENGNRADFQNVVLL